MPPKTKKAAPAATTLKSPKLSKKTTTKNNNLVEETPNSASFSSISSISAIVSPTAPPPPPPPKPTNRGTTSRSYKTSVIQSPKLTHFTSTVKQPSRTREIDNFDEDESALSDSKSLSPLVLKKKKIAAKTTNAQELSFNDTDFKDAFKTNEELIEDMLFNDANSKPPSPKVSASVSKILTSDFPEKIKTKITDNKENQETAGDLVPKKSKSSIKIRKIVKPVVEIEPVENVASSVTTTERPKRKINSIKTLDYNESSPKAKKKQISKVTNYERKDECPGNLFQVEEDEDCVIVKEHDSDSDEFNNKRKVTKRSSRQKSAKASNVIFNSGNPSSEDELDDAYEFKPSKTKKAPLVKRPPPKKRTTAREQRIIDLQEKEMEEAAKEYESLKDYKLIVEHVDHDY